MRLQAISHAGFGINEPQSAKVSSNNTNTDQPQGYHMFQ